MAKPTTLDKKLDALTTIVEQGFTAADRKFAALADDITDIRRDMATKDDVRAVIHDDVPGIIQEFVPGLVAVELKPLLHEHREITRRLDVLDDHYRNIPGFAKEIDELRARVKEIERHLKLAA
jgi:hypothetical protein